MKTAYKILFILFCISIGYSCTKEYGPYEYAPTANFLETSISLSETDAPVEFGLFLYNRTDKSEVSVTISGDSVVETGIQGALYGDDFLISPEPTSINGNKLTWTLTDFNSNDTTVFRVTPIHNPLSIEHKKFSFKIDATDGNLQVGGRSSLQLMINNVDESIEGYELGVSPLFLNFTTGVAAGDISEAKSLTLTARNLTKDVVVIKTANFKFSMSDDPDTAKEVLVIPLTAFVNDQVTFYVFFAPTSSSSGSKSGQLVIQSYGVKDAKVALRGNQI